MSIVLALSADKEYLTFEQAQLSLSWVGIVFDVFDEALSDGRLDVETIPFSRSVSQTLNNVLEAMAPTGEHSVGGREELSSYCGIVKSVQSHLNRLLRSEVSQHVAGELAAILDADSMVARVVRASTTQHKGAIHSY